MCLDKKNKISRARTRTGGIVYRTQIGDAAFCRWLATIGIGPRKSLTIGALRVPDKYLLVVARGLLDGDGSIINKRAGRTSVAAMIITGSTCKPSSFAQVGHTSTGCGGESESRLASTA